MRNAGFMIVGALAMAGFGWGLRAANAGPVLTPTSPTPTPITVLPPKIKLVPVTPTGEKLASLASVLGKTKTAGDLGTPFRLSAAQMQIDAATTMTAYNPMWVAPHAEYDDGSWGPLVMLPGNNPPAATFLALTWSAAPNKAYYFDCVGVPSGTSAPGYQVYVKNGATSESTVVSNKNGHIAQVILPQATQHAVHVTINPTTASPLVLNYCEITPVN